jgi:long-chain acyl-CoA synthetase
MAVFCEDPHQLEKILEGRGDLPTLKHIVYWGPVARLDKPDAKGRTRVTLEEVMPDAVDGVLSLDDLTALGDGLDGAQASLAERAASVGPDSVCTIVYTSGTTGDPKGVVLTHDAFVFECGAIADALKMGPDDEQLLFLPLAHIFAKVLMFAAIRLGYVTSFAEGIPKVVQNIGEVKPTFMGSVPRIYEKVYTKVVSGAEQAGGLKKKIFDWSVSVGQEVSGERQAGREPTGLLAFKYGIATKLVFSKLHTLFGGRLRFFISGGAPLSKDIAEFFHAAGILVLEGYGLTETTAATHINRSDAYKFGTVGQALESVEVKVAEDGEILMRGRNIMREYFGKPDATAESLDGDGWFHSGDIGEIDDLGFLRITDRKKDLIVTAGGKNIAPQMLENSLKVSPYISQAMVHGDKRKFLAALITLDEDTAKAWAGDNGIQFKDLADLSQHPKVFELIQGEVDKRNAELPSYERIKKFAILEQDLSQEAGELTPTLKVKRKAVTERYRSLLDSFYDEKF